MKTHCFLFFLSLIGGVAAALSGTTVFGKTSRPNIVFIFSDDHALQAISAYDYRGRGLNRTPNIDRLADEGALFTENFCGNSICSPSRATVLTGKHSHRNGVTKWQRFNGDQFTFPKALRDSGYVTALYGKWHLGSNPTGFDDWAIYRGQGNYYNPDYITATGQKQVQGYATDLTTDMSLEFLKKNKEGGKPFLLMCQYKAPHRTWLPSPTEFGLFKGVEFKEPGNLFDNYENRSGVAKKNIMEIGKHMRMGYDLKNPVKKIADKSRMTEEQFEALAGLYRSENKKFGKMGLEGKDLTRWKYQHYLRDYLLTVGAVDRNVGRILDYLDETGLAENTIVIYGSDQGFFLGEHGWFDKRWMYEESFRMPLLWRWPGVVKAGLKIEELTQNIDYAPTFLEIAGVAIPDEIQGMSMMPLLKGEKVKWRDALYYHYYDGPGEHGVAKHYGVRTERYKLIRYYAEVDQTWEMFDLEEDPEEMVSVYGNPKYEEVQKKLKERLLELKKEYDNQIFTEADEKRLLP